MNTQKTCVYVHKDSVSGEIRYVGSGSITRPYSKTSRSKEHLEYWANLKVEILYSNLIANEAKDKECELILKQDFSRLFNKVRSTGKWVDIKYTDVCELLEYCEESPTFLRWKVDRKSSRSNLLGANRGDVAGFIDKSTGYVKVKINCTRLQGHRVIFAIVNRVDIPSNLIVDHVDRNRSNNKIENLRLVEASINNRNKDFNKDFNIKRLPKCNSFSIRWTDKAGKRRTICLNFTKEIELVGLIEAEKSCYYKCVKIRDDINTSILNQNWEFDIEQILHHNGVNEEQCKKILKTQRKI